MKNDTNEDGHNLMVMDTRKHNFWLFKCKLLLYIKLEQQQENEKINTTSSTKENKAKTFIDLIGNHFIHPRKKKLNFTESFLPSSKTHLPIQSFPFKKHDFSLQQILKNQS